MPFPFFFLLKLRQTIDSKTNKIFSFSEWWWTSSICFFFLRSHQLRIVIFQQLKKEKKNFFYLLRDWRWKKEVKYTIPLFHSDRIEKRKLCIKKIERIRRRGEKKNLKLSILEMPFTVATSMSQFDKRSSNILAAATQKTSICPRRVWSAVEKRVPKKPRPWIYILPVVDAHVSEWNHRVEITASTLLHTVSARA